jgi:hypothetical protein
MLSAVTESQPGIVYARLLTRDDPVADERLAAEAAEAFSQSGLSLQVQMPILRGGMGAGGGPPIDAWIYIVLPVAGVAGGAFLGGFLAAIGSDFWKALKLSIRLLHTRNRPARRAIVLLMLRTRAGDEVRILLHPDDPIDAIDILETRGFKPPNEGHGSVMVAWDHASHTWAVGIVEAPH